MSTEQPTFPQRIAEVLNAFDKFNNLVNQAAENIGLTTKPAEFSPPKLQQF